MDLPGLLFLSALLAVKEAGLPIPVPGDLLVIGAGVAAARGGLPAPAVIAVLVGATVVGGIVQFALIRGPARARVLRLLGRVGIRPATVDRGAARLRSGGAPAVAVARMTPGVRIIAIASSAVAGIATTSFVVGLAVGNGVFLTGHFVLGAIVGQPAIRIVSSAGSTLIVLGIALAVVGAVGWWLIARRRARGAAGGSSAAEGLAALDWTDACCPACLALAVVVPAGSTERA